MSSPIDPSREVDSISKETSSSSTPSGDKFRSYMGKKEGPTSSQPRPIDLASTPTQGSTDLPALMGTARNVQDSMGELEKQIKTPNLRLKRSQSRLLKSKLQEAHRSFQGAAKHLGLNPLDTPHFEGSGVERFLSYLNRGQEQMAEVQGKLKELSSSSKPLNPADLLLVQVKMSQAQQAIEYSSVLLSKVIDSIKSLMNIQL